MSSSLSSRRFFVLSAAAVACVVAAIAPTVIQARVPAGPRLDTMSFTCGQMQDRYDQGVRDLEFASKYGTQAQYDAALANLQSMIREWNGSPCSRVFGSLVYFTTPAVGTKGSNATTADPNLNGGTTTGGSTTSSTYNVGKTTSVK